MKKIKTVLAASLFVGSSLLLSSCDGGTTGNSAGNTTGAEPDPERVTGVDGSGDLPGTGRKDSAGIIPMEADTLGMTTGSTTGQ